MAPKTTIDEEAGKGYCRVIDNTVVSTITATVQIDLTRDGYPVGFEFDWPLLTEEG